MLVTMALDGCAGSEPETHVAVFVLWQPSGKIVEFVATGLPEQDAPVKNDVAYDDAELHAILIENVPELLTKETQPPASGANGGRGGGPDKVPGRRRECKP